MKTRLLKRCENLLRKSCLILGWQKKKSQGRSEIFSKSESRCCNITLKYHLPFTSELEFLNCFGVFVADFPALSAVQCLLLLFLWLVSSVSPTSAEISPRFFFSSSALAMLTHVYHSPRHTFSGRTELVGTERCS